MSRDERVAKPRWWKLTLLPSWLAHALEFFAFVMLIAYPLAAATASAEAGWTSFAVAIIFSLVYGLYAGHRIRRTIVASDETSYTIRLEWAPPRTCTPRALVARAEARQDEQRGSRRRRFRRQPRPMQPTRVHDDQSERAMKQHREAEKHDTDDRGRALRGNERGRSQPVRQQPTAPATLPPLLTYAGS